jgi:hypothetical protein
VETADNPIYDFLEDGAAYLNAVETGKTVEVTEQTFDYFLNVLPPVYMHRLVMIDGVERRVAFGFAEGCEHIVAFWKARGVHGMRCFCKRTSEMNRS